MKTYDAIIIGFGKGGKTLAADLGARGWQVAVIEQSDKMYGGTCINVGCIPTKTLVHQAKLATYRPGLTFVQRSEHYRRAIRRKEEVTALLRDKNYRNLADKPNITVYTGTGSFAGPDEVDVTFTADYPVRRDAGRDPGIGIAGGTDKTESTNGTATAKIPAGTAAGGYAKGEKLRLKADRIFINTGAETVIPPIAGVRESDRVYTSTSIMELEELPKRLVIVGGGYIGLEFASMYAEFGSQVTVLESYPELIPREDRDIAASVRATLEKRGVTFRLNTQVESVQDGKTCAYVTVRESGNGAGSTGNRNTNNPAGSDTDGSRQVLEAEAVLLATGRKPNTAGLNLEAAGIRTDPRGSVMVDDRLQTTNPKVWALGDVKGGLQFTYISLDDYRIVRDELFGTGERKTQDRLPVAYAVFTDPPLSRIGINEEEARRKGLEIRVNSIPVASIPRMHTIGETEGVLKAVIDARTDEILGCTLFAPESSEVINTVALAMKNGNKASLLRDMIFTHPSMSEALNDLFK